MKKPQRFFKIVKPETIALRPKPLKFPSISLTIPEGWLENTVLSPASLTVFTCGFLLVAISIVGVNMRSDLARLESVRYQRSVLEARIAEWQGIAAQYSGYRDAFYQLAVLEYRLGNYHAAYGYLEKTLAIDPDYPEAKKLLSLLFGN